MEANFIALILLLPLYLIFFGLSKSSYQLRILVKHIHGSIRLVHSQIGYVCIGNMFKYVRNIQTLILDHRSDFKVEGFA